MPLMQRVAIERTGSDPPFRVSTASRTNLYLIIIVPVLFSERRKDLANFR